VEPAAGDAAAPVLAVHGWKHCTQQPAPREVLSLIVGQGKAQAEQLTHPKHHHQAKSSVSSRESLSYLHSKDDLLFEREVTKDEPDDIVLLQTQTNTGAAASPAAGSTTAAAGAATTGVTPPSFRADDGIPRKHNLAGLAMPDACLKMYDYVRQSRKARYFASFDRYVNVLSDIKDRLEGLMWDANVVCKCLGHCPIKQFENLSLLEACRYDERNEESMAYVLEINDPD